MAFRSVQAIPGDELESVRRLRESQEGGPGSGPQGKKSSAISKVFPKSKGQSAHDVAKNAGLHKAGKQKTIMGTSTVYKSPTNPSSKRDSNMEISGKILVHSDGSWNHMMGGSSEATGKDGASLKRYFSH